MTTSSTPPSSPTVTPPAQRATPATPPTAAPFRPRVRVPGLEAHRRRLILLQGPPGTGKSHCAATFPNPFFLLFDPGSATHDRLGVPYAIVRDWDEVERYWLRALIERRLSSLVQSIELPDGTHPFEGYRVETLVLDSLTFYVDANLIELGGGGTRDVGQQGWDTYYSRIHQLLNAAKIAARPDSRRPDAETYHLVATVHENERVTGPEGEIKETVNAIQGKMNGRLGAFFDAHYLTHVEVSSGGRTYWLLTRPQRFQAKGRGKLIINHTRDCKGDTIVGPAMAPRVRNTYPALMEAWEAARSAPAPTPAVPTATATNPTETQP